MTERDRHEGRVSLSHWYAAPIFNRCPASASGRSGILASALSLGQRGYGHAARGVAKSAVVRSDVVHAGSARAAALFAPPALLVLRHAPHAGNGKEPHR
jgi:hypothetical protein